MGQDQPPTHPPPQHQARQPGVESEMTPRPRAEDQTDRGSGKREHKAALITGGDRGIGRAVALAFATAGAGVAIAYVSEHGDAQEPRAWVGNAGRRCLASSGDVGAEGFCRRVVQDTVREFGRLDVLANNAAEQPPQEGLEDMTGEPLERPFRTDIFAYFYVAKAALSHLREGSAIINTTSVTAYRGSAHLLDYAATKGAIVACTRSLAKALAGRGIRVNGGAPGPIWPPLIPAPCPAERGATFGTDVPVQRAGQPEEVAPSDVFLASDDASSMAGQVLHPNGGEVVNGEGGEAGFIRGYLARALRAGMPATRGSGVARCRRSDARASPPTRGPSLVGRDRPSRRISSLRLVQGTDYVSACHVVMTGRGPA